MTAAAMFIALAIDALTIFLQRDLGRIAAGDTNQFGRGTGMKAESVLNDDFTLEHANSPVSLPQTAADNS